jgi:hypothetical protein
MVVVRHEGVGVNEKAVSTAAFAENLQKLLVVSAAGENEVALIAARHHMVEGAGKL